MHLVGMNHLVAELNGVWRTPVGGFINHSDTPKSSENVGLW